MCQIISDKNAHEQEEFIIEIVSPLVSETWIDHSKLGANSLVGIHQSIESSTVWLMLCIYTSYSVQTEVKRQKSNETHEKKNYLLLSMKQPSYYWFPIINDVLNY